MSIVRPCLKGLHSPDIPDMQTFQAAEADNFCFLLQVFFGPDGAPGEEAFDILVCTPKWLEQNLAEGAIVPGRHRLIVRRYDIESLRAYLVRYAHRCEGPSWSDVAQKLGRTGRWEFEDYVDA